MLYEVGDTVRIVDKWNESTMQVDDGRMDKYLGKVMTIVSIYRNRTYRMQEDSGVWAWNENCILNYCVNYDEEDLVKPKKIRRLDIPRSDMPEPIFSNRPIEYAHVSSTSYIHEIGSWIDAEPLISVDSFSPIIIDDEDEDDEDLYEEDDEDDDWGTDF